MRNDSPFQINQLWQIPESKDSTEIKIIDRLTLMLSETAEVADDFEARIATLEGELERLIEMNGKLDRKYIEEANAASDARVKHRAAAKELNTAMDEVAMLRARVAELEKRPLNVGDRVRVTEGTTGRSGWSHVAKGDTGVVEVAREPEPGRTYVRLDSSGYGRYILTELLEQIQ